MKGKRPARVSAARRPRSSSPRHRLPSVDEALRSEAARPLLGEHPRVRVTEAVRAVLAGMRRSGRSPGDCGQILRRASGWLAEDEFQRHRPVINATGVVLHTNLGRAVLPAAAARALASLDRCSSLQIDLETGARGRRHAMVERLLCRLTGAEAALVVNNNAAATLLALSALCRGREVVVSRGQLIEIGGSYRLPDCIHQSGAILREVGTTNKTHPRDYEQAIGERTAALLRVNPSNYRIVGFTRDVSISELAAFKAARPDLLVLDDLGCGALLDLRRFGLPYEPTVSDSLRAGADVAFFSGDKLIGGPQAGILAGRADLIARIRKHPLTRMLRAGKLTDLALERTLRLFLDPEGLVRDHPTLRMLTLAPETIRTRAESLAAAGLAAGAPEGSLRVRPCESATGGGALPGRGLPSFAIEAVAAGVSAEAMLRTLRRNDPPVIGYIRDGAVWLDVRTVLEDEFDVFSHALAAAVRARSGARPRPSRVSRKAPRS